jgi:hypothetical protein
MIKFKLSAYIWGPSNDDNEDYCLSECNNMSYDR